MVDPNTEAVELVDSRHAAWREAFAAERERLQRVLEVHDLADACARIEHVGSTAVPELSAKDIVDIDVVVAPDAVEPVSRAIASALGGHRVENSDGWHPVFRTHGGQRFNDHVFATSNDGWKVSVATRDVLRKRPGLRERYEHRKRELAAAHDELGPYSRGKTEVIEALLETAKTDDDLTFAFDVPDSP